MAKIKHQLFQIPILSSGKLLEKSQSGVLKEINDFLEDGKRIYMNHSITTTGTNILKNFLKDAVENEEVYNKNSYTNPQHTQGVSYFRHTNVDKYVIVSLIYKELEEEEIEEGIFRGESTKLPKAKALEKPKAISEADKLILKTNKNKV